MGDILMFMTISNNRSRISSDLFICIIIISSLLLINAKATQSCVSSDGSLSYGSGMIVDGQYNEWDLSKDFFSNMWRAGDPNKPNPVLESKLFLRYDCSAGTMYALVLNEPGVIGVNSADDAWIKVDGNKVVGGSSGDNGEPPDFQWIRDSSNNIIGYEASFNKATGSYSLDAHIQVNDDGSQTSRTNKNKICLVISCPMITIIKDAQPNDNNDFSFIGTNPIGAFILDDDSSASIPSSRTFSVPPGDYIITEGMVSGWDLSAISKTSGPGTVLFSSDGVNWHAAFLHGDKSAKISVASCETKVKFINKKFSSRIKLTPSSGINAVGEEHVITATVEQLDGANWIPISEAKVTYSISSDTTSTAIINPTSCVTGTGGRCTTTLKATTAGLVNVHARADINNDGVIDCETNGLLGSSADASKTYVDARIVLDPLSASNKVGDPHAVTATVETSEDGTNWIKAPAGTQVVFSVTSGAATFTDTNTQTTTKSTVDTTGQCSATISSADAGANTIHAETDVMIGTKTVHLSTGVSAGSSADASKTYAEVGSVTGTKFYDLNGNGAKNEGEPGISGWTINLKKDGATIATTTTDTDGIYIFTGIAPGSYTVEEELRLGWTQTAPAGNFYTIKVFDTGEVTVKSDSVQTEVAPNEVDFGNQGMGSDVYALSGVKFNDVNGDGSKAGDPLLGGWTINLKQGSAIVKTATTSTDTATLGSYRISGISPGTYTLGEEPSLSSGWTQTYPPGNIYTVVVSEIGEVTVTESDQNVVSSTEADFGNRFKESPGQESPLKITKTAQAVTLIPNMQTTFTIIVENIGEIEIHDIKIVDELSPMLEFIPPAKYGDIVIEHTIAGGNLILDLTPIGSLEPGRFWTITYNVKLRPEACNKASSITTLPPIITDGETILSVMAAESDPPNILQMIDALSRNKTKLEAKLESIKKQRDTFYKAGAALKSGTKSIAETNYTLNNYTNISTGETLQEQFNATGFLVFSEYSRPAKYDLLATTYGMKRKLTSITSSRRRRLSR
jgi:hypothetical protein